MTGKESKVAGAALFSGSPRDAGWPLPRRENAPPIVVFAAENPAEIDPKGPGKPLRSILGAGEGAELVVPPDGVGG
jgi:hypothetical protein